MVEFRFIKRHFKVSKNKILCSIYNSKIPKCHNMHKITCFTIVWVMIVEASKQNNLNEKILYMHYSLITQALQKVES